MSQNFQIEKNENPKKIIDDKDSMKPISNNSLNQENQSSQESKEEKVKVIYENGSQQNSHENSQEIINSRKSSSFNLEDLKNDITIMRSEMNDGLSTLRSEVNVGFSSLKKEMKDGFSSLKNEISKVAILLTTFLDQLKVGDFVVKKEDELKAK